MKISKIIYLCLLVSSAISFGQKAERGFKHLEKNDILKASENFTKTLEDDSTNCAAHFGMSIFLSHEKNTSVDYFKAWDEFMLAKKYFSNLTEDDNAFLKEFFTLRDSERRNKTIKFNFDIEEKIIEDKLIKYVREENNLEIAEKFIAVYPNSRFYENVVHIRNHIEYRLAEKANTLEAYSSFLEKYPEAAQVNEAIKARNELAFQQAKKANTIKAFNDFIKSFPESYHYYDAIKLRDQMAFDFAKKQNSIEALDNFIGTYPTSLQVPAAKIIQRKLLYEKAKQVNTLDAYNDFISRYPEGDFFVDIFNLKSNVLGEEMLKSAQGNKEMIKWIKGFDFGQKNDSAGGIVLTSDRKIIISGTRNKFEQPGTEAWVICINNEGKTLWDKSFGSMPHNVVNMEYLTLEGDILLAGWNGITEDTLSRKAWLFEISATGSGKWERNLDGKEIESLHICPSGDMFVSGYNTTDSLSESLFLMKLNNSYNKLWSREYLKVGTLHSFAATQAQNLVMGAGRWIWKTDALGYIQWEKLLPATDSIISVSIIPGGLFYISGSRNNSPYIAKMNDQGAISWEKNLTELEGFHFDFAYAMPDKTTLARFQGEGYIGLLVLSDKGQIIKEIRFNESKAKISHSIAVNTLGEIYWVFTKNNYSNSEIIVCKVIAK